jgi:hypothetical protein
MKKMYNGTQYRKYILPKFAQPLLKLNFRWLTASGNSEADIMGTIVVLKIDYFLTCKCYDQIF